ncbi:amidase signature domain-containing protein [Trichoderma compactum]
MSPKFDILTATADDLERELSSGGINSKQLVKIYLSQIERHNDYLKAVISTAPEPLLLERAAILDDERQSGKLRSPLHGIPILVKDNVATHPSTGLDTTAGSLALVDSKPGSNAPIVDRLLEAELIIIGKASLSELSWWKGTHLLRGWNSISGQGQSPYVKGGLLVGDSFAGHSNPGGSSSGSAIANTKDLAVLMDIITDPDNVPSDGYASRVTGSWEGLKIGTLDPEKWTYPPEVRKVLDEGMEKQLNDEIRDAYATIKQHVSVFRDNVPLRTADTLTINGEDVLLKIFEKDFKEQFEDYLELLETPKIKTLGELIAFNKENADRELPTGYDNQDILIRSEDTDITPEDRSNYVAHLKKLGRDQGIDKVFDEYGINVVMGPLESPLYYFAAACGAVAKEEGFLIQLQSAYERAFPPREPPTLLS